MTKRVSSSSKTALPFSKTLLAAGLSAVLLSGCASLTQSTFNRPDVSLPDQWQYAEQAAGEIDAQFWRLFNDEGLNQAIDQAVARNNDLALAALRVQQAQLRADLTGNSRWPIASGSFSNNGSRNLGRSDSFDNNYSANLGLRFELDLWGKLKHQQDADRWEAEATEYDRQAAYLSLIGTTSNLYWQIAYLEERMRLSNESIAYAQKTLELVNAQYSVGSVSRLEVISAEQRLASQQAEQTQIKQQLVEAKNAFSVLFNQAPQNAAPVVLPTKLPSADLPGIPAGIPANVLANRPDMRAAEARLRSVLADKDAVTASYYPDISLTAGLGFASAALGQLLHDPSGMLGLSSSLNFLDVRGMRLNKAIAKNQYEQTVINYRQSLYDSLAEVEDNLAARKHYVEQEQALKQSLAAAQEAERLYELRYKNGSSSLKDWLDTQESRRSAEQAVIANHYNRLLNEMNIYLALGGATKPATAIAVTSKPATVVVEESTPAASTAE